MHLQSLFLSAVAVSSVSLGWGALDKPSASNLIWSDEPAVVVYPQEDKNPDGNFGKYKKPSAVWEAEGYPIGNGRVGAMIFSAPNRERFALNEISLWSGGPNPGGGYGYGLNAGTNQFGNYLPFGDLFVDFKKGDQPASVSVEDFTRALDLRDGIHKVNYKADGVTYDREAFASTPANVLVLEYKASKPGQFSADFSINSQLESAISAKGPVITWKGTLKNGMNYEGRVLIRPKGGTLSTADDKISVKNADSCMVVIAMETDYLMDYKKDWKGEAPAKKLDRYAAKAASADYAALKQAHIAQYKSMFDRVKVNFGKTEADVAKLPIPKRLEAYKKNPVDPDLEETMFQYGRYLLLSSSRPGTLPANLQGLWNAYLNPPWACDYHNNINVQMAYWGAEPANLSECHEALINYVEAMAPGCRDVSQANKGFNTKDGKPVRGWTVRTSQNIFGGNGWQWNIPGAAWYALHVWEHYAFTGDRKYLEKQAYPLMKEICHFWEDHLKELGARGEGFKTNGKDPNEEEKKDLADVKAGTLVAPNGWSPEHGPREDGVMHDQQLIAELFTNTIKAARILGKDASWAKSLEGKLKRLAGNKIGKEGNLQEWMIDRIPKTDHRHTSHLFAVFPGNQISKLKTPKLAEAARLSLEWRGTTGDSRRSWTWPWRTALWARLGDGNKAHEMVQGLLKFNTLPNMLTTHPPMQMDGNFGIVGGICEMLVQSHAGGLDIMPSPVEAWPEGSVKGLKARGNVTVDFSWKNGKVSNVKLYSDQPKVLPVRVNGKMTRMKTLPLKPGAEAPQAAAR